MQRHVRDHKAGMQALIGRVSRTWDVPQVITRSLRVFRNADQQALTRDYLRTADCKIEEVRVRPRSHFPSASTASAIRRSSAGALFCVN